MRLWVPGRKAYHAKAQPARRGSEPASSMPVAASRRMISTLHGPWRSPTALTGWPRRASSRRTPSGEALLDRQRVLAVMRPVGVLARDVRGPARHLGRLLRVESEIDHRRQDLH